MLRKLSQRESYGHKVKMKLTIEGDINISYVQNLCLIFFPGSKFSENQETTEDTPKAFVRITKEENGCRAYVRLEVGDRAEEGNSFVAFDPLYSAHNTEQIAVGTAFYDAGSRLIKYNPPWGILTGIRPGKIATRLYGELGTKTAVKKALTRDYLLSPKKAQLITNVSWTEQKILQKYKKDTCSLYISIPFCPTRCAYCSFVSYATPRLLSMIPEYLKRLKADIKEMIEVIRQKGQRIVTIYIGGGTPTTLNEDELKDLLGYIAEEIDVKYLDEYTLEGGRPDTVTPEKLRVAVRNGVSRVSINPQTLNDEILKGIGRRHSADDFFRAFYQARTADVPAVNTDIIAGLPGDNFASFANTVDQIAELRPENITVHTFFVKKASDILHSGVNVYSRNSREAVKCVDYSQLVAASHKYHPYYLYRQKNTVGNLENVGFSLDGFDGIYNCLIMAEMHDIYACGAGAVTKLVSADGSGIKRFYMPKYPYEYLDMPIDSAERKKIFNDILDYQ